MEGLVYLRAASALWLLWLASWWVAMLWANKPAAEAPRNTWRWYIWLVALGFVGMGWGRFDTGRLWPVGPALGWSMVALTAASFLFAWWARITMGKMWSGGVMRTDEHKVIQTGPFAWVRHPIYTALITAGIAIAVIRGTPIAVGGAALIATGFYLKARVEERFLTEELTGYPEYRARVPMLVPLTKFGNQSTRLS
jgi:protein-S-isoprenylcysteine O-methyltransferase Ste14